MGGVLNSRKIFLVVAIFLGSTSVGIAQNAPENPDTFLSPNPVFDDNDAYCTGRFKDYTDDQGQLEVEWIVDSTQVKQENFPNIQNETEINSTLDSSNFVNGQEVLCNITASDDEGNQVSESDNTIAETFDPEITSGPTFYNYTSEHAFNVSAIVLDKEGDDEIDSCRIQVVDEQGNTFEDLMQMDRSFGDNEHARCFYSKIEESSDFEVLESLDIRVSANDSADREGDKIKPHPIPNSPPLIYNLKPGDDSETSSSSIDLEASVLDRNGEQIDLWFYNDSGSNPELIHGPDSFENLDSGDKASTTWSDLETLKTYYWYVNASDGHQNTTQRLRFRNVVSPDFKVQTNIEHRYSTVIIPVNGTRTVVFSVKNKGSSQKQLTSTVSGANAQFTSSSSTQKGYTIDAGSRKDFSIRLSPENLGQNNLQIVTEYQNYDLALEDRLNVFATKQVTTKMDVPGMAFIQLIFVLVASTLYYSALL